MNLIGKWFESFIEPEIGYLKTEGFGPFLALTIGIVGAAALFLTLMHFFSFYRQLKNAIAAVQNFESEEEFYKKYEEIDQFFQNKPGLGVCWRGGSYLDALRVVNERLVRGKRDLYTI